MKNSKKSVIISASLAIMLCVSVLVSGTFAWFTDKATVSVNKVQSGKLDVTLNMRNNPDDEWESAEGQTLSFLRKEEGKLVVPAEDDPVLWEPGATYKLPELQIENKGNLAFKYKVVINGATGDTKLLDVIKFTAQVTNEDGTLSEIQNAYGAEVICEGRLKPGKTYETISLSGHMSEDAGNDYQGLEVENIAVTVYATQVSYETDSDGNTYDMDAKYTEFVSAGKTYLSGNHTLSVGVTATEANAAALKVSGEGTEVTVLDGAYDGGSDGNNVCVYALNGGKVTIKGGTFTVGGDAGGNGNSIVYSNGGEIVIEGGFFHTDYQWGGKYYVLNQNNSNPGTITVKGGTFVNQNPADGDDNLGGNFVAEGYMVVSETKDNGDVWYTVVPKGELEKGGTIDVTADIITNNSEDVASARITITEETTLNLDKKIKSPDNMGNNGKNFAALYIEADTTINAGAEGGIDTGINGGYGINILKGATVTINGGYYYGGGTAVQVQKGTLIINGGTFACAPFGDPYGYKYLINCVDGAYKDGTAKVVIKGGTFVNWNPASSEGDKKDDVNANFVADGYKVVSEQKTNGDTWYTVVAE